MLSFADERSIRRLTAPLLCFVLLVLTLSGCSIYHTRLFDTGDQQEICVNQICFTPRVVAFDGVMDNAKWIDEHGFWISLRIQDKAVETPDNPLRKNYAATRDSLAELLKERITTIFHVDSLVIHPVSDGDPIIALPDTTRMEPRGIDFVTYQFGRVTIPLQVDRLKAVFHYSGHAAEESVVARDSVGFQMDRRELHQKEIRRRTRTGLSG
jgi:hypothetical protein